MFKDTDHTADVIRRMRGATGRRAIAGIFSPEREKEAEKLGYQEFGTKDEEGTTLMPQRQTVAPAFDQGEDAIVRAIAADLSDAAEGKLSPGAVAENTAQTLAANIRKRIESNTPPELADSTKAARRRRGNNSTDTLVDTRDMLKAIAHDVQEGEGSDG